MIVLGLTGSIGMGKSTTADMFRFFGAPVHDSDATVHALYRGAAAPLIEAAFPGTTREGVVDRTLLAPRVLNDHAAMERLEAIIHPLVRAEKEAFLADARAKGVDVAVLDIPLLFETGQTEGIDAVAVVTAPANVQKVRVLARPGMTEEKFAAIIARQMSDADKRARADFIIDTGHGLEVAEAAVARVLKSLAAGQMSEKK